MRPSQAKNQTQIKLCIIIHCFMSQNESPSWRLAVDFRPQSAGKPAGDTSIKRQLFCGRPAWYARYAGPERLARRKGKLRLGHLCRSFNGGRQERAGEHPGGRSEVPSITLFRTSCQTKSRAFTARTRLLRFLYLWWLARASQWLPAARRRDGRFEAFEVAKPATNNISSDNSLNEIVPSIRLAALPITALLPDREQVLCERLSHRFVLLRINGGS